MANPSIGLKIANGYFYPILNEKTEGKKKIVLTTIKDGQTSVQIDLYRKEDAERNEYVGSLRINHIKPAPAGEVEVELILGIDESGNLIASARDSSTGEYKTFSVRLEKLSGRDAFGGNPEYELESVADTNQPHREATGERLEQEQVPEPVPPPIAAYRSETPSVERKSTWRQPIRPEPEPEHDPEPPRAHAEAVPSRHDSRREPSGAFGAASTRGREDDRYDRDEERPSRFTAVEEDEPEEVYRSIPSRASGMRSDLDEDQEEYEKRKVNPILLVLFVVLGLLFIGLIGYLLLLLLQGGGTPPLEAMSDDAALLSKASLLFFPFRNRR